MRVHSIGVFALVCVSAVAALDVDVDFDDDDNECPSDMVEIRTLRSNVCCPGVEKNDDFDTVCCIDGDDDDDHDDLSSCRDTVDADDDDYSDKVEDITGDRPPSPDAAAGLRAPVFAILGLAGTSALWYTF